MGIVHLGRGRQRLHDLRLAAAILDSLSGRLCDDGCVLFRAGADDDCGQHCNHGRRLVAVETGVLKLAGSGRFWDAPVLADNSDDARVIFDEEDGFHRINRGKQANGATGVKTTIIAATAPNDALDSLPPACILGVHMPSITETMIIEHRVFLDVFDQIESRLPALESLAEAQFLADLVKSLLEKHGRQEEDLAYAALDHALAERGQIDCLYQDHQEIDGRLAQIEATRDLKKARRLIKTMITLARRHFQREERVIFPLIEKTLQGNTLKKLERAWIHPELAGKTSAKHGASTLAVTMEPVTMEPVAIHAAEAPPS